MSEKSQKSQNSNHISRGSSQKSSRGSIQSGRGGRGGRGRGSSRNSRTKSQNSKSTPKKDENNPGIETAIPLPPEVTPPKSSIPMQSSASYASNKTKHSYSSKFSRKKGPSKESSVKLQKEQSENDFGKRSVQHQCAEFD